MAMAKPPKKSTKPTKSAGAAGPTPTAEAPLGASQRVIELQQGLLQDGVELWKEFVRLASRGVVVPSEWMKPVVKMLESSATRADSFARFLRSLG